ncbi:hypothetical protein GFS60_08002 (plasmid) [Rhodococcus sp. WAY2]|nr:hypothetical protein GFS60_08002 [Rhodococcus sp. WAY2]
MVVAPNLSGADPSAIPEIDGARMTQNSSGTAGDAGDGAAGGVECGVHVVPIVAVDHPVTGGVWTRSTATDRMGRTTMVS